MKKVLVLAYYFPPIAASGSMRPAGFCSHLPEFGFSPHVVSADPETKYLAATVDPSLSRLLPSELKIERIGHASLLDSMLEARQKFRAIINREYVPESSTAAATQGAPEVPPGFLSTLKSDVLNRVFLFPDRQKSWAPAVRRYARRLDRSEYPDVVFATGNPWSALLAGLSVAKHFNVPFVADFRDPWSQNPKPPRSPKIGAAAQKLEAYVIRRATRVVLNTERLRRSFIDLYPDSRDRLVTITNGYHESVAELFASLGDGRKQGSNSIDYYGTTYELRRPTALLKAIRELHAERKLSRSCPAVRFVGHWIVSDPECNTLADELEDAGLIERKAPLNHEDYLRCIARSKYLLVLQQDFPLQVPAKIYEYIASGRPLILIGGDGATSDLIAENGLGTVCRDDIGSLKQMLLVAANNDPAPLDENKTNRRKFGYRALTGQLAETLNAAIAATRSSK